jgi:hypothetical protein
MKNEAAELIDELITLVEKEWRQNSTEEPIEVNRII